MDTLQNKTQVYWAFSRQLQGRTGKYFTTEQALKGTTAMLENLGPQRRLSTVIYNIQAEIIDGSFTKRKPKPTTPNVVTFPQTTERALSARA